MIYILRQSNLHLPYQYVHNEAEGVKHQANVFVYCSNKNFINAAMGGARDVTEWKSSDRNDTPTIRLIRRWRYVPMIPRCNSNEIPAGEIHFRAGSSRIATEREEIGAGCEGG